MSIKKKFELQMIKTLITKGDLPSVEELDERLQYFREKFGYEALNINGKDLLLKLHKKFQKEEEQSLAYWLENKNDDEFPNYFGSIFVGSSGQFRVYFSPRDNCWKNKDLEKISEAEAIEIAEENRDMLITASRKCEELLNGLKLENYKKFDEFLKTNYPEFHGKQWVHKYLFLMNPNKLSDIHSSRYLLHMLLRLGIQPENPLGYYELDYYYVSLANKNNYLTPHLTSYIFDIFGKTHRYWKVQLRDVSQIIGDSLKDNYLQYIKDNNVFCFGLKMLGDLEDFYSGGRINPFKEKIKKKLEQLSESEKLPEYDLIAQDFAYFYNYCGRKGLRDIILILNENKLILIGQLYEKTDLNYEPGEEFPYQREINWIEVDENIELEVPKSKICFSQIKMKRNSELIVKIEKIRYSPDEKIEYKLAIEESLISNSLRRKKQLILYGPPGTGKTYWAMRAAKQFISNKNFKKYYSQLSIQEEKEIEKYIYKCCFHPSYGYEDFIIGFRPKIEGNQLVFKLENGIFKEMCEKALKEPQKDFIMVIDEINRGDIPRIFGELMMIIEKDKRGESIHIPYSDKLFQIPSNVYILGTMNTADRSIALLDTALRRRFSFIEFMPDYSILDVSVESEGLKLYLNKWLELMNKRIRNILGKDGRNLQIGHAYLLKKEGVPIHEIDTFAVTFRQDIIPLLEEYCYEDYETLSKILGEKIVLKSELRINDSLFKSDNWTDLIKTIIEEYPEASVEEKIDVSLEEEED